MSHSLKETITTQELFPRYKLESRHSSCSGHAAAVVAGTQKNDTFSISDNSLNVKGKAAGPEAGGDGSSLDNTTATTNSASDRLEMKIKANFAESEIEGDLGADSNFQLIKTNIQSILQKFFTNVQDLELYKNKFNDLIAKKHTRDEMDAFVNEVMAHLKETESRQTLDLGHETYSCSCRGDCYCAQYSSDANETHTRRNEHKDINIISFKNMNFKSDTSEGGSNKPDVEFIKDQRTFKTMDHAKDRPPITLSSNFSEMILRASFDIDIMEAASAENLPKLEAKRVELENINAGDESDKSEKDIPIKVSHPKRNIHTDEDFSCRRNDDSETFLSKLCGFLCKRFRRHC